MGLWTKEQICPFDYSLPDPVIPDGECSVHYNIHKVKLESWNWFNKNGHGAINRHYGRHNDKSLYDAYPAIRRMKMRDWNEMRMLMIIDQFWYTEYYLAPIEVRKKIIEARGQTVL